MRGGRKSPDGKVEIILGTNDFNWPRNIASKGLGCCSFRSLDYAARWQYVPELIGLPEKMRDDGIPGGGYPEKVERILERYGKDIPHYQDTTGEVRFLAAMCASKRMPCVDYSGHCPHYAHGIAHCVNVVACDLDNDWIAILDNNYPKDTEIVWMGLAEFRKRWHGWSYGILKETPGSYDRGQGGGGYEGYLDDSGQLTYGLIRTTAARLAPLTLDGKEVEADALLKLIGPEMVPAKPARPLPVGPGPALPDWLAHPLTWLGGGLVVAYLVSRRKASP